MPRIEEKRAKVRKVKRPSEVRGLVDIETHPTTLTDLKARMVPPRTVRNIRGGHLLKSFHEINRIGYKESERLVAEALHTQDKQRIDQASRIYIALSQVQGALNQAQKEKQKAQVFAEELQASNEEMQATNEEMEASNEELKATTEELQRTGEQMQQFASVASHELQEPLRMVASYMQLIEKRYKAKLDKKGKEFMAFAIDGAKRMQRLVNDLLTYSRVSTRAKPFEQTNFEDVLNQVLSDMQVTIKKDRALVTHDRLPAVIADKEQIGQLLQNLINNSIKFRKKKARPRIHISAKQKGREWIFSVRDNGIGISPQHKDKIFQIFQRLHGQKEYTGTGIGLAVCKNIVQRHGGRIWIKSKPGKGATFYFTIPVRKKKEEAIRRKKADERWQEAKEARSRTPEAETKKAKKKKRR